VVGRALATGGRPGAAVTVKEDNVIRFCLTRTPHPLPALPPADDPDLPAPRPPKKLGADGLASGTSEHVGVGPRVEQADGALAVFGAEVLGWRVP